MPCLCPPTPQSLSGLVPSVSLSLRAVPPQMGHLLSLLGLQEETFSTARSDLSMSAALPSMDAQTWFASLFPGASHFCMPRLMMLTAQMSALSGSFPMHDPRAVLEELKRSLRSLRAYLSPFSTSMQSISRPQLANMTLAARMTLSLRAQGLCPMALSGVDMSYSNAMNLGCPHATLSVAIGAHARLGTASFPAFGMTLPKLNLAMNLAALAPLTDAPMTLGLPAISDPGFSSAAMDLLSGLGGIPALPLDISQLTGALTMISDLSAINEAFGPDAMSPAGIGRVQAMLNYMFSLNLPPLPSAALSLQTQLDMLPSMDDVWAGAEVAQTGASTFAASMRFDPSLPVILPFLSALDVLKAVLGHAFGEMPDSCSVCRIAA